MGNIYRIRSGRPDNMMTDTNNLSIVYNKNI